MSSLGSSIIHCNGERSSQPFLPTTKSVDVDKDKVFPYPRQSELIVICRITTATFHKNIAYRITRESFVISLV